MPTSMRRWHLGLRLALILLLGISSVSTAAFVHGSWQRTADRNAHALVAEINDHITASVANDLTSLIANAEATQAALRTIFFQDVIRIDNEAKREFVFLSMLQSQPSLSWVAFGWPNGNFFGAAKDQQDNIRMVEVRHERDADLGTFRVDNYLTTTGDIIFQQRQITATTFRATRQPWYQQAAAAHIPVWSDARDFPTGTQPAIAISERLEVYGHYLGVMAVTIDLTRLAHFLAGLSVSRHGHAFILAENGRILPGMTREGVLEMDWGMLGDNADPSVRVVAQAIRQGHLDLAKINAEYNFDLNDTVNGSEYFVNIAPLPFRHWSVATIIPAEDILGDIPAATRRLYLQMIGLVSLLLLIAVVAADRLISRPIGAIMRQMREIEHFHIDRLSYRPSALRELDHLSRAVQQMGAGLSSFRKYLPADLVETLVARGIDAKPGGHRQAVTVLFSDLAGFTGLTEAAPDETVAFLGSHLQAMSEIIHGQAGTVDKFIGDSVMALWNAPSDHPHHALAACRAALACQRRFNEMRSMADPAGIGRIDLRLGINSGEALVGNIGSPDRLNYTAIGDTVNIASRLESLNKQYGTSILIGAATAAEAGDQLTIRHLDRVAVYGRQSGLDIYELIDDTIPGNVKPNWIVQYERGLAAYMARDWDPAIAAFQTAQASRGGDAPSRLMIRRCENFRDEPPPIDWDGTEVSVRK
ncbi:MAG TPA: adenylate/guanylate cyclase domain-containing protein [Dongiaceae bacterium]|nr:adenylate/guanylate cyclase domain-containing protein [Dongiaceae bacterium]